ncbi:MAG TPA: hypothetical protein VH951_07530 [Dehalococcoidia bacterium]
MRPDATDETESQALKTAVLRVGVTGHRRLDDAAGISVRLREELSTLVDRLARVEDAHVAVAVVSPLADGADRLLAHEVLDNPAHMPQFAGATLEAPLPFERSRYLQDFDATSAQEFERLAALATEVLALSAPDGYAAVGRYVVDHCDVMVAIWDGQEPRGAGGTGDIVEYARSRGRPLIWISSLPPHSVTRERLDAVNLSPLVGPGGDKPVQIAFRRPGRGHEQGPEPTSLGRIPFRLRIGLLADGGAGPAITEALRHELQLRLAELEDGITPISLTLVVEPGAEGAALAASIIDAAAVMPCFRDTRVEVVEPRPSPDVTSPRVGRVNGHRPEEPGSPSRARAIAGRHIVDHCDILVAVWDGSHGQPESPLEQVVTYARTVEMPLVVLDPGSASVTRERLGDPAPGVLREVKRYNSAGIDDAYFRRRLAERHRQVTRGATDAGVDPLMAREYSDWISPFFVRADTLAHRYQFRFDMGFVALLALFFGSVAAPGVARGLHLAQWPFALIEAMCLLAAIALVALGRNYKIHDRWITCRFLAERCRSAYFLAVAGLEDRRAANLERVQLGHWSEPFVRRAFSELWQRRPDVHAAREHESVARLLAEEWLHDQLIYFDRRSRSYARRQGWVGVVIAVLVVISFSVAVVEVIAAFTAGLEGDVLDFATRAAILLPPLAASLGAYLVQKEFERNAERYGRMVGHLGEAIAEVHATRSLKELQSLAREAELMMLAEGTEWFTVMKFHDFELRG